MNEGHQADIRFAGAGSAMDATATLDAEPGNPIDLQRDGWQAL